MTSYDEQPPKTPPAYRFNDPRQERIYRRLLLVGPGPTAFYRDVCRLMAAGPVVDATTHLVAHLLREIESAIRDVLLPRGHVAPKGKGKHRAEIEAILRAYGIDPSDPAAVAWLRLSDDAHDERLAPFAHRDSLGAPRRLDDAFREFVTEVEAIFDVVLQRFEGRFLGSLPVIDESIRPYQRVFISRPSTSKRNGAFRMRVAWKRSLNNSDASPIASGRLRQSRTPRRFTMECVSEFFPSDSSLARFSE